MQTKKSLLKTLLSFAKINLILMMFFGYTHGLRLTEVFLFGQNERIEIYNDDSKNFSGTLQIEGIKSKQLQLKNVFIGSGKFLIVGDNIDFSGDFEVLSGMGLSISDTKDIKISLSASGHVLDNFVYSGQETKNKNFTLQKIFLNGQPFILPTIDVYSNGLVKGIFANPGKVIFTDNIIQKKSVSSPKAIITKQPKKTYLKKDDSSKIEKKYLDKIDKLEKQNSELKSQLKLSKNAMYLTWSKLRKNRNAVYQNGGFQEIKNSYTVLSTLSGDSIKVGNIDVDKVDIDDYMRALSRKKSLDLNHEIYIFIKENFLDDLIKPVNEGIFNLILLIQKSGRGNIDFLSFGADIFTLSAR